MALCLLSHFGTLLTHDPQTGAVGQVPLRDCSDATSLLEFDLPEDAFAEYFLEFLEARLPEPRSIGPFSRASLVSVDGLLVALKLGDRYFGVADDGRIVNHAETIGSWESFLPVSRRTIDALRDALASDWLVEETRTLVPAAAIDLAPGMTLVVGSERFRLDELSTLAIEPGCGTLTFLAGGWRLRRLFRWDPVVTFTAYRSEDVMEQMTLCVASLLDPGGYSGRIHVLTDRPDGEIRERLAAVGASRVTTGWIRAIDFAGWVASKFAILDEPSLRTARPILFLDADIVFDRPVVLDMLIAIALSPRRPRTTRGSRTRSRSVPSSFATPATTILATLAASMAARSAFRTSPTTKPTCNSSERSSCATSAGTAATRSHGSIRRSRTT